MTLSSVTHLCVGRHRRLRCTEPTSLWGMSALRCCSIKAAPSPVCSPACLPRAARQTTRAVEGGVFKLAGSVTQLKKLVDALGTPKDTVEHRHRISETNQTIQQVRVFLLFVRVVRRPGPVSAWPPALGLLAKRTSAQATMQSPHAPCCSVG